MGIDELKARLERLLAEQGLAGATRQEASGLHDALVDLKVGLKELHETLERTRKELAAEQEQLATTIRRGELAQGINDAETAAIAAEFAERHRQRVSLLERKLAVQQDELALAEREYQTVSERYQAAKQGIPNPGSSGPAAAAAGDDGELLKARFDRRTLEAAAEAQLELLKKKMGKS